MSFTATLRLDPVGPVKPGGTVRVTGTCLPADGDGVVTVILHLPAKADGFAYAIDPFGFSPEREGRFEATLTVPVFDAGDGIDATIDATAVIFYNGDWATVADSVPLHISPRDGHTAPENPEPSNPPTGGTSQDAGLPRLYTKQEEIDHLRMIIFDTAGESYNRTGDDGYLEIQKAIDMMKRGVPFVFARLPR